jgi:serine protease Do
MNSLARHTLAALLILCPMALAARADVDIDARARATAQSLVIVDFTLHNENSSRTDSGQGILLSKEGVVMISGALISESLPREWITEIKVRLPADNFAAVPAKFLGRTRNRLFAYLKTEKPVNGVPFVPGEMTDIKLGQQVFSVAVSGSAGGYSTFTGKSDVRAILELTHTLGNTATFGLTRGTSPVFDAASGGFAGITVPSLGESVTLREGNASRRVELLDEEQSSVFLPVSEVRDALTDIPTEPFNLRRPWLAVDDLTGLQEDIRSLKGIKQTAGIVVGSVIPGESADQAGLKPKDIILTIDGREFSKKSVPEWMVMHFSRTIEEKKPGDKITLGVLRDGKKLDIPVTLGTSPKMSSEMAHILSPKIGLVTRDLVFADLYQRRLPQDTKGVMVALVTKDSPAALGATPLRAGLLITKVDDQPVDNQQQFLEVMKKEEAKTDLKEMVFVVIQSTGDTQVCRVDLTK